MGGIKKEKDNIPEAHTMGWRVFDWRTKKGLSQAALGGLIGTSQGTVSRIEQNRIAQGHAGPIAKLAALMGLTVEQLQTGKEPEARGPSEKEVLQIWRRMNPTHRQAWLAVGKSSLALQGEAEERPHHAVKTRA